MKKDWKLLLMYAFIGIVAAGVAGCFLYKHRLKFWQMQARSVFPVALQEELQKWKEIDVHRSMSGNVRLPDDSVGMEKKPIKVSLESEYGKRDYWIPYEKYSRNIEQAFELRGICSYLLHVSPPNADSLNMFWKNRLAAMGFSGTTVVRISVSDWQERESYTYSADSSYLSKSDSLSVYYIGCRCEVGVTGYLYHPWWTVLSWKEMALMVALIVSCILLFFMRGYVYRVYYRLFVKEKHIVIEKEVPVVVGRESRPHTYRLEEGVYFDADSRLLKKGDDVVKLAPLLARLLQGFLDAENYTLSNDEILHLLWPDGSGTQDKLYQNIKRLRNYLSKISICTVEGEKFVYHLKIHRSIKEYPA
ncbi:winged helix-turn-helix domain-containing protein [Bacteroides muris (ex Fokt et al. 2023)]|uniref:Helix-turn-helix domain-containing protein n=1 Tax=Bacteroides muris (ex Fokt et al. 2023) TaxID=2937417 RepID=A0A9X2NLT5_9BACE|nr:helix-turn-helix domain-containing protein [Bacteroides muris (ex Fokt et al. 2023)]MCR6503196.1 helix-turn-helix domain-containing protein [Bacteroides muris (ex Fokt et al. 2023)]